MALEGIISVKQAPYNAVGDGTTDDTAAIQAAVNAAIDASIPTTQIRYARYAIYFPPGQYRITSPIVFKSIQGITVFGMGFGVGAHPYSMAILRGYGAIDCIFDFDGVGWAMVDGLTFMGNLPAEGGGPLDCPKNLLWWRKTASLNPLSPSTRFLVSRCLFFGHWREHALRLGAQPGTNLQQDMSHVREIIVQGEWTPGNTTKWQGAISWGDGAAANAVSHSGNGIMTMSTRYGLICNNTEVDVRASNVQSTEADVYFAGGRLRAGGWRSEHSSRLLFSDPMSTSVTGACTIEDVRFRVDDPAVNNGYGLATDGAVIRYGFAGTLDLTNLVFTAADPTAMTPPRQTHALIGGPNRLGVTADRLMVKQTSVDDFFRIQQFQGEPGVIGRQYVQTDANDHVVEAGSAMEFSFGLPGSVLNRSQKRYGSVGAAHDTELQRLAPGVIGVGLGTFRTLARQRKVRTVSTDVFVASEDDVLRIDASGGNVIIWLPGATGSGRNLTFKRVDSSSNTCTIHRAGSDMIDGVVASFTLGALGVAEIIDAAAGAWDRLAT